MIEAVVMAAGLVAGVDWRVVLLAAGAAWAPVPAAAALAVFALAGRRAAARDREGQDVRFAETVVGELRAGASLRAALRVACSDRPGTAGIVRRLDVGEPLDRAVAGLSELLPSIGELVETAVVAGGGGGRMLPTFEELMVHASTLDAAAAEYRTALAPVRASMAVLVGAPSLYLAWSLVTGRLARLLQVPGGLWLALAGSGLFVIGMAVMLVMARSGR